jgi:phage terminase Nu1 subunit (DNA packaging protein)
MIDEPSQPELFARSESEANQVSNRSAVCLPITSLASEFGSSRETIRKILDDQNIKPEKSVGGYAVYRLRDVIKAWAAPMTTDIERMAPHQRLASAKADEALLRLNTARGQLLRREDCETEWARVMKAIAHELDTMVDEIERDCATTPLILEKIESKIDIIRTRMHASIVNVPELTASDEPR